MQHFSSHLASAWLTAVALFVALAAPASVAQSPSPTLAVGTQSPQAVSGKVTLVFYWATTCPVCRDSLPELRANQQGWSKKPFALVSVNVDKNRSDWVSYESIMKATQAAKASPPAAAAPGWISQFQDTAPVGKLPITLLVNTSGKIIARYEGRLAPEVWDVVAELLP